MEDLGKMEGLQKWKTWGNGGDLGKTEFLGKRRICINAGIWLHGGPGKMEGLAKWRTWVNGGSAEMENLGKRRRPRETEDLEKQMICGNAGSGEMEDLWKWRTWRK